tara:strand:+ start:216 stop:659 length:444 start_codon:yes stop_codon:yes gene_type:complete
VNKLNLVVSATELSTIQEIIYSGGIPHIAVKEVLGISSMRWHKYLEKNPKIKSEFDKAQEIGVKVLVEKMLNVFNSEHMDLNPNELLFLRERSSFLKWLAPRLSSLFQEKQKIDVKSDSVVKISWESEPDLIDVNAETISAPTPPKD